MEHFKSILRHKSGPANKRHTNKSIRMACSGPQWASAPGIITIIWMTSLKNPLLIQIGLHMLYKTVLYRAKHDAINVWQRKPLVFIISSLCSESDCAVFSRFGTSA